MHSSLRVIFAGAGEFGAPTLRALPGAGHEVVQVITQLDRPAGRGRALTPTPIAAVAEAMGLPVVKTKDINALDLPDCDLLVVIAFGQKIAESVTQRPRLGSVNLHASRLPRHRGAAPINAAILAGDEATGNSIIRLAQKMDAGAVLGQSLMQIGNLETAGELHDRLSVDGVPLMLTVMQQLADGTAVEVEQDHSKSTLARKLSRESAKINWEIDAASIARQIRGLWPWPGCRVQVVEGEKILDTLGLVRARVVAGVPDQIPGTLLEKNRVIAVAAGDGHAVEILEVQPAGKRPMPIDAYSRGKKWSSGLRLLPI